MRADAERSTARILEAAETVLALHPGASLERIADEAGVARATVHRRFASRQALLDALVEQLNQRYARALEQARVATAPPVVALEYVSEIVFELKISHPFVIGLSAEQSPEVRAGIDMLFARLRHAGDITASGPDWCRAVYLSLMTEVHLMPDDAPDLVTAGSRAALLTKAVLGALRGA